MAEAGAEIQHPHALADAGGLQQHHRRLRDRLRLTFEARDLRRLAAEDVGRGRVGRPLRRGSRSGFLITSGEPDCYASPGAAAGRRVNSRRRRGADWSSRTA